MKSRTSFFNTTILKKDITRFAPVWALYGVFLLIRFAGANAPIRVVNALGGMSFVNFFYAGICASVLFGDLFQSRMCNALHALPMRRECWFITHTGAGFLFSFVPNAIATLALCVVLEEYFYLALVWLAVMTLQYLFFFGVGCLSVMCAGNRLGMYTVYGIINFLSLLVFVLAEQFYQPLLYGVKVNSTGFDRFCPLAFLLDSDFISFNYSDFSGTFLIGGFIWEDWLYLGIIAVIGLGLWVASMALYRRRRLEVAGDFIALRPLQPVFLIIYTLVAGLFLYGINGLFGLEIAYGFMFLGIVIGFFTGRMLLERTVKVFRPKNILGFVAFAVIFGSSLLVTRLDPLGITRKIPSTQDVAYVRMYIADDAYLFLPSVNNCLQAESAEDIEQIQHIHETLIQEQFPNGMSATPLVLQYQCKDGSVLTRYYYMSPESEVYDPVVKHLSSPEYLFSPEGARLLPTAVTSVQFDMSSTAYSKYYGEIITDQVLIHTLVDAIIADCEAGRMAQHYTLNTQDAHVAYLILDLNTFLFTVPVDGMQSKSVIYLGIDESCIYTIQALEEIIAQLETA